jgi:hypothetical protein
LKTRISIAAALAALVAAAGTTAASAAHYSRLAQASAATLAAAGTALFSKRGHPPWYYGARARTTLTCIQETSVSYYCSETAPESGGQPYVLAEYFVRVTGGYAIWNAISATSPASLANSNSSVEGSGPIWSSTTVAMTSAP